MIKINIYELTDPIDNYPLTIFSGETNKVRLSMLANARIYSIYRWAKKHGLELKTTLIDRVDRQQEEWWLSYYIDLYKSWGIEFESTFRSSFSSSNRLYPFFQKVEAKKVVNTFFSKYQYLRISITEVRNFICHISRQLKRDEKSSRFGKTISLMYESLLALHLCLFDGLPLSKLDSINLYRLKNGYFSLAEVFHPLSNDSLAFIEFLKKTKMKKMFKEEYQWRYLDSNFLCFYLNAIFFYEGIKSRVNPQIFAFSALKHHAKNSPYQVLTHFLSEYKSQSNDNSWSSYGNFSIYKSQLTSPIPLVSNKEVDKLYEDFYPKPNID